MTPDTSGDPAAPPPPTPPPGTTPPPGPTPPPGLDADAPTVVTPPPGGSTPPPTPAMSTPATEFEGVDPSAPTVVTPGPDAPTTPPAPPTGPLGAEPDTLIGRTIGGCRITTKIGQGGMGAAYKAEHLALHKDVVVKILPSAYAGSEQMRERFLLEARTTARLSHGNIVQVYDVGQSEGVCYYVMEYVDGESLDDVCKQGGPLSYAEATRVVSEAARGLAVAHEAGVLHRDVKPSNLIRTRKGVTKVLDFGLARDVSAEGLTVSGQILGTPHYMAPEQADGAADARSDLYSLGITYFWLLTNELPFHGSGTFNIVMQHMRQPPPPLRKFLPDAPEAICAVIDRLLEKDPADRFQTADELADVLDGISRHLAGGPAVVVLGASGGSSWGRLAAGAAVLAVAVGVGLIALQGGAWSVRPGDATSAAVTPQPPPVEPRPTPDPSPEPDPTAPEPPPEPTPVTPDPAPIEPVEPAEETPPAPPAIRYATPTGDVVRDTTVVVEGSLEGELEDMTLAANGRPVELTDGRFRVELTDLPDGEHVLELTVLWRAQPLKSERWAVCVDATPPRLTWSAPTAGQVVTVDALPADRTVAVGVTVSGETGPVAVRARVAAEGAAPQPLAAADGAFAARLALRPQDGRVWVGRVPLEAVATDEAGNEAVVRAELIVVPSGMVLVGDPGLGKAGPLSAFFMDRDEVTNVRLREFLEATGVAAPRRFDPSEPDLHPAMYATYELAVRFAAWRHRRLPTEREWAVAAGWRGGRQASFPWGDDVRRDLDVNVAYCRGREADVRPVGASADDVSPWGCRDMAGNLQEWTTADPPGTGELQAIKGGYYGSHKLQAADARNRAEKPPGLSFRQFGFRCARSLDLGQEVDP